MSAHGYRMAMPRRGAHAQRLPPEQRAAARARFYRRILAITGAVWCAALAFEHARTPGLELASPVGGSGGVVAAVARLPARVVNAATALTPDTRPTSPAAPPVFTAAAASCPGLPWQVLAAIAQVETGGGRWVRVSPAGAIGPMQLLPSTWAEYRPWAGARIGNLEDAATAAARLLCANGAPANLRNALWNYNHSDFYVDQVFQAMAALDSGPHLIGRVNPGR